MFFVPIVPTTSAASEPSPRVRELTHLLTKVVEEYSAAHPSVSNAELRQAIRLAQGSVKGGGPTAAVAISLGLGVLVAGLAGGLFFLRAGDGVDLQEVGPIAIAVVILFVAVILMAVKAASR